jgi:hypothetical protein
MAKLTAAARKKIAPAAFGVPPANGKSGKYPMPDKAHAANAKARASQMVKKGKLSRSVKARIDTQANKVLGKNK